MKGAGHGFGVDAKKVASFFGSVTASATHEIRNILAIIGEASGLLEDLSVLARKEEILPYPEKWERALGTIREQVVRGGRLLGYLNRFAHSPDVPRASVDLGDVLAEVVALSERFARQRRVGLHLQSQTEPSPIVTQPLMVRLLFFEITKICVESCDEEGKVIIDFRSMDETCGVAWICYPAADPRMTEQRLLSMWEKSGMEALAKELGARTEFAGSPPRIHLKWLDSPV